MKAKVVPPFVVRVRFTHSVMSREGCSGGKQGERKKKRNRRCNIQELNKGLMTFEAEFVFVSQF